MSEKNNIKEGDQRRGSATWNTKMDATKFFNFKYYNGSQKARTEILGKKEEKIEAEIKKEVEKKIYNKKKEAKKQEEKKKKDEIKKEEEKVEEKKEEINKKEEIKKEEIKKEEKEVDNKKDEVKKEEEKVSYYEWFQRHSKSKPIQLPENLKQEDKNEEEIKYERNNMGYEQWFYKHSGKIHEINDSIEKALGIMRTDKEKFNNFDKLEQQLKKIEEKKVNLSDINTNISYVTERLKAIISYFKSIRFKEQEKLNKFKSVINKNNTQIRKQKKGLNRYNDSDKAKAQGLATYFQEKKQELYKEIKPLEEQNNQHKRYKNKLQKLINAYDEKIVQFEEKLKLLKHISFILTPIKVKQQAPKTLFNKENKTKVVFHQHYLYLPYTKSLYTRSYIKIPIDQNKCNLNEIKIEGRNKSGQWYTLDKDSADVKKILSEGGKVKLYNKKPFDLSSLKDREIQIVK